MIQRVTILHIVISIVFGVFFVLTIDAAIAAALVTILAANSAVEVRRDIVRSRESVVAP